jgi:hypothetical protein
LVTSDLPAFPYHNLNLHLTQFPDQTENQFGAQEQKGGACIVTLECAAILPCSEAEDVVGHIEAVWQRGKEAIDALREALGPDLQDALCPLRNGGVSLHKLYGVMHDTCNCANKVNA